MNPKDLLLHWMFGRPRGFLGRLGGRLMTRNDKREIAEWAPAELGVEPTDHVLEGTPVERDSCPLFALGADQSSRSIARSSISSHPISSTDRSYEVLESYIPPTTEVRSAHRQCRVIERAILHLKRQ